MSKDFGFFYDDADKVLDANFIGELTEVRIDLYWCSEGPFNHFISFSTDYGVEEFAGLVDSARAERRNEQP